jgi:hypothetical protein
MIRRGAGAFALEEEVLVEALSKRKGRRTAPAGPAGRPGPSGGAGWEARPARAAAGGAVTSAAAGGAVAVAGENPASIDPIERELAARCLTEEGAILEVAAAGGASCFRSSALQGLLRTWLQMGRAPLPEELRSLTDLEPLARALLAEQPLEEGRTDEMSRRGARELLQRLEERRLKASIQELDRAIRRAEGEQDLGSLDRLVAERRDLASKLHSRNHPAAP